MSTSKLANTDGEGHYTGARIGGIPAVVEQIAKHLPAFEHHLLLPSSLPSGIFKRPTEWNGGIATEQREGLSIHFFPNEGEIFDYPYVNYTLKGLLEQSYPDFKFDVIVTHITPEDMDLSGLHKKARWIDVTHGSKLRGSYEPHIDAYWVMSEWQKSNLGNREKGVVIPMPIDDEVFNTHPAETTATQFVVKDSNIVWHGRIAPEKRIIPFSHILKEKVPSKSLHVVGGPDHQFAQEQDGIFNGNTTLHGRLFDEELATELRKHRYYVLPSKYETFCVALLEALACGCEPLCIRHPALEWASPYVRFYDSLEEMAEALATLDDEPYESHSEIIHNTHSWRVLEPRLSALFAGSPSEGEADDSYAQACMDDDGGQTNH